MKKTITLEIPDGKKAEWINGVLTLVDVEDNRPITERVKTYEDVVRILGYDPAATLDEARMVANDACDNEEKSLYNEVITPDIIAYVKLRAIAQVLNEGWTPQFTVGERRWYPWFWLYTKEEIDEMNSEDRSRVVLRSNSYASAYGGVAYAFANNDSSLALPNYGSRLAFKTADLAKYAGTQFTEIWADFVFRPKAKSADFSEAGNGKEG